MDEVLFGSIAVVLAVVLLLVLILWSRRIIERIHRLGPGSPREIRKGLNRGR